MEHRDGTAYLRRFGSNRSRLFVSPQALERLRDQHDPEAMARLRQDVDQARADQGAILRKVNGHGARILKLEDFKRKTEGYLRSLLED